MRRRIGGPSRAVWQYGAAMMPPVAALAAALAALDYFVPEAFGVRSIKAFAIVLIAASAVALAMLLWRIRNTSRRLKRWDVWISIFLAILVIAGLGIVLWRAPSSEAPSRPREPPQREGQPDVSA
jgi:cytochrome bd-type quinol oxidase subunit 2